MLDTGPLSAFRLAVLFLSMGSITSSAEGILDAVAVKKQIIEHPIATTEGKVFTFHLDGSYQMEWGGNRIIGSVEIRSDGTICERVSHHSSRPTGCYSFQHPAPGLLLMCYAIPSGCYDSVMANGPKRCSDGVPKCQPVRSN